MPTARLFALSLAAALVTLVLVVGGIALWQRLSGPDESRYGGDFTLLHMSGEARRLSSLPGRFKLLYFGYTSCPDVCPLALANLVRALEILDPAERARVQPVFVSVDPERDRPEAVRSYLGLFATDSVQFEGFSGTPASTHRVVREQFRLYYERVDDPRYTEYIMNHPSLFLLLDSQGRLIPGGLIQDRAERGAHRTIARELAALLERY